MGNSIVDKEIMFSQISMGDDFGRVFYREDKLYRAIYQEKKEYCSNLINSPLFSELSNRNLIPKTKIANFKALLLFIPEKKSNVAFMTNGKRL